MQRTSNKWHNGGNIVPLRDPIRIPPIPPGARRVSHHYPALSDAVHLHRVAEMVREDAKHPLFGVEDRETCMWVDGYMRARAEGDMERCRRMLRLMRQGGQGGVAQ